MRFLADENFPKLVVEALRGSGHDVTWMSVESPGAADREVLERAQRQKRVVLTFDKDFGDLVFRSGAEASCGVVLFRIPLARPTDLAHEVVAVIGSRDDWQNHFSVVEPAQIRIRKLPS